LGEEYVKRWQYLCDYQAHKTVDDYWLVQACQNDDKYTMKKEGQRRDNRYCSNLEVIRY
jgi:hypothetical protein